MAHLCECYTLSVPIYEGAILKRIYLPRLHAGNKDSVLCRELARTSFLTTRQMYKENYIKKYEVSTIRSDFYSMRWVYY